MKVDDDAIRDRLELPLGHWNTRAGLKDSAVLAILVERAGSDHVVFNRRADGLPDHAGQICFPGGGREGGEDAVTCALRETCEEMGLARGDFTLLGRLPDRVSIAGFLVAPFVARLREPRPYRPALDEVAEVFEIPCARLLEPERWGMQEVTHERARFRRVPYFLHEEHRVWGLTGVMLRDFVTQALSFAPPL